MKIALAGPPQSGKTENAGVFADLGWRFVNLNDTGDALRCHGGPFRAAFESLAPDIRILDEKGKRQAAYYQAVRRDPSLLERFTALELPYIIRAARFHADEGGDAVLSWEQWELLADHVRIDHVLFLTCREDVWLERLRQRAYRRGYEGPPLPDAILKGMMEAGGFSPSRMLAALHAACGRERLTPVDTSPEDWGAENLRQALSSLRT